MNAAVVPAVLAARKNMRKQPEAKKPQLRRVNALHAKPAVEHDENSAAGVIGRAYRRAKMGALVHRQVLLDRVELEEALCAGVVRLVLFILLFLFLIVANTSNGITSEHKRHLTTLMDQTLELDHFLGIKSLEGVREYLPLLSERLKEFSMSSSARFQDSEVRALQILGPRTTFNSPLRVLGLNPPVGQGDFTLTAWVETSPSARARENLLRMPLATNPELSCWAWSHPSQFRFGAHDFYSPEEEPDEWEEVIRVGGPVAAGLTHEMVILRNGTLTFFRDAQPIASVPLRREMTECLTPGVFELGDSGLGLSSVKFYPRALLVGEVQEIFFGGQPLSELATGTVLEHVELDTTEAIKVAIQAGTDEVGAKVESAQHASSVDSVVGVAATYQLQEPPYVEQLYPDGQAPPAVHWQDDPSLLSPRNLEEWDGAGRPSSLSAVATEEWRRGPQGDFFSFLERPVYGARLPPEVNPDRRVDPPLTGTGPAWNASVTGLTFSYWLQPAEADKMFWCDVSFRRAGAEDGDVDQIMLTNYGHVLWLDLRRRWGAERFGPWKFLTFLDKDSGKLEEKFIFTKYVNRPGPAAWRHIAFSVDFESRAVLLYVDGRLFAHSLVEEEGDPFGINYEPFPAHWTPDMLSSLRVHTFSGTLLEWGGCRVAQVRVYPRVLGDREVLDVQNAATWDDGSGVKQCADMASDFDFADSTEVDDRRRSCAWYHETRKTNPEVCLAARARAMCPFTCQGRRTCYDGSLFREGRGENPAKVHTVFTHIKHIIPGNRSVICPSSAVDPAALYQKCLRDRAASPPIPPWEYQFPGQYIFHQISRADLNSCEELAAAVDAEHCGWDGSWVPELMAEWEERRELSVSLWVRPKQRSLGMPHNFWPSVHMYSRLHRPYTLLEGSESFPEFEPLWRFFFNAAGSRNDRLLVVSNHVPYAEQWTYLHFQIKRRETDDGWTACGALNAVKATCIELDDDQGAYNLKDGIGWPREFLEGIEFTTEMLVTPIEVQAKAFTPAQIQQRYYKRRDNMERIRGPAPPQAAPVYNEETSNFDSHVALVTPPLIFQSRAQAVTCNASTTRPLLASQFELVKAAHCPTQESCPRASSDEMATCLGGESHDRYFGLVPFRFSGSSGVCDFLYTLADHDVVVRDGRTYPTRIFLDGQTMHFVVIVVLHMPTNGMSTLLELQGSTDGLAVQTKVNYFHYGYLHKSEHLYAIEKFSAVFVILALIVLLNALLLVKAMRERQRWHLPFNLRDMMGIIYDVLQAAVVGGFSVSALIDLLNSEDQAASVLESLTAVPFSSADVSFESKLSSFFAAAEKLYSALDAESRKTAFAFAIMILMLFRIIRATAAHPRTGVLTGTVARGFNDFYHFALLFMVIFFFFSYAATWLFADTREDFRDLAMSMETQFQILLGNLPKNFSSNRWLIIYVGICSITLFFLMLNFLLALVVDAYMSVREEIVRNEAENEFFHDIALTLHGWYKLQREQWPSLRAVAYLLRHRIASRHVSAVHFVLQGVDLGPAKAMVEHYHQMRNVKAGRLTATRHKHQHNGNGNGSQQDLSKGEAPVQEGAEHAVHEDAEHAGPAHAGVHGEHPHHWPGHVTDEKVHGDAIERGHSGGENGHTADENGHSAGQFGHSAGENGHSAGQYGHSAGENGHSSAHHGERGAVHHLSAEITVLPETRQMVMPEVQRGHVTPPAPLPPRLL